jgi:plastocyanin
LSKPLILGLLSLVLAGCASAEALTEVGPLRTDPTVHLTVQSIQGSDVTVKIVTTNFKVVPPGQATDPHKYGEGHFHIFLDVPLTPPGEVIPKINGIYHTTDSVFTIHNVPNGHHTVAVMLGYSDHLPYEAVSVVDSKVIGAVAALSLDVNGSNFVAPTEPSPQPSQSTAAAPSAAPSSAASSAPSGGGATIQVKVEPDPTNLGKYVPTPTSIRVGGTVKWTFDDDQNNPHTATADDGSFDSSTKVTGNKGDVFSFTFTKAGSFAYHCNYHANMKGTVTVS